MKDNDLTRRLALASHELRMQLPPATLLPAIHRQLDRPRTKPRTLASRWFAWAGWAGLSTACVALTVALVVHSIADEREEVVVHDGFVPLVSDEVWERAQVAPNRTWVVTTELPHSRLAALGLPYDPARAGERVNAQLLMHSSGEVLAVRVGHSNGGTP